MKPGLSSTKNDPVKGLNKTNVAIVVLTSIIANYATLCLSYTGLYFVVTSVGTQCSYNITGITNIRQYSAMTSVRHHLTTKATDAGILRNKLDSSVQYIRCQPSELNSAAASQGHTNIDGPTFTVTTIPVLLSLHEPEPD